MKYDQKTSIILGIFIASLCSNTTCFAQQDRNEVDHSAAILAFFATDSHYSNYLLDEINIVEQQRADFQVIAKDLIHEQLKLQAEFLRLSEESKDSFVLDKKKNDLREIVRSRLNEILVPGQYETLVGVIAQRSLLQLHNCETYELFGKVSRQLNLTPEEESDLRRKSRDAKNDFVQQRQEIEKKARERLVKLVPDEIWKAQKDSLELMAIATRAIPRGGQVTARVVSEWKEDDFEFFEKKFHQDLVFACLGSAELREVLLITDDQLSELVSINQSASPPKSLQNDKAKLAQMAANGDRQNLEKYFHEQERKIVDWRSTVVAKMEGSLIENQISAIEFLANFRRKIIESGGDEFGAIEGFCKSKNISSKKMSEIAREVSKIRQEHAKEMTKLRSRSSKDVFESLSQPTRKKFVALFSQPYDYQTEKSTNWKSSDTQKH